MASRMMTEGMTTTHSVWALNWITSELKAMGIEDFRFCLENDCYVCDRFGHFYSVCKRQRSRTGRLINKYRIIRLNGSVDRDGYATYRVTVDGVKKHLKAHRMMLNAWVCGNPDLVVNHKDGNKANNSLDNLEWCTVAENNAHAIATGLFDPHMARNFHYSVPVADWMTVYILYKHCGYSLSELGKMNGCKHETIKKIIQRIDKIMPEEVLRGQRD